MKKLFLLLLLTVCCLSCEDYEDETVDITVMPEATTIGADTFGCLVDGWLYVGGRYSYSGEWFIGGATPSIVFKYDTTSKEMYASVEVKNHIYFDFTIQSPQEGKVSELKDVQLGNEKLSDAKVTITRFDTKRNIVSGTFEGGLISKGRFDVHYREIEKPVYPNPESPQ